VGFHVCGSLLTHPHPNPPLEGEGIVCVPPLEWEGIVCVPPLEWEGIVCVPPLEWEGIVCVPPLEWEGIVCVPPIQGRGISTPPPSRGRLGGGWGNSARDFSINCLQNAIEVCCYITIPKAHYLKASQF
jgi:hypothetical protein